MALVLESGKWYITKGDYLVYITKDNDFLFASVETSPGYSISGRSVKDMYSDKHGWYYEADGSINGLSPEWNEKLRIIREYTYPVVLPDGFEWKGGFPKLYTAKELVDCCYLSVDKNALHLSTEINFYSDQFGPKRIGLVKKETMTTPELKLEVGKWYITKGDYFVNIVDKLDDNNFIASLETSPGTTCISNSLAIHCFPFNQGWSYKSSGKVISLLNPPWNNDLEIMAEYPHPVKLPDGYEWKGGYPRLYEYKQLDPKDYFISSSGFPSVTKQTSSFGSISFLDNKRIGLVKKEVAPMPTPTPPKIRLEAGKWYITAGGYIINIKKIGYGNIAYSTPETSPASPGSGFGGSWAYNIDGSIDGLGKKWEKELPIVAEYPYPVVVPDEFTWKGGYPKLYELSELNDSDCFLTVADISATMSASVYKGPASVHKSFDKIGTVGKKRIGLVKKDDVSSKELKLAVGKWYVTAGDYLVNITGEKNGCFVSSLETSPGVDIYRKFAKDIVSKGDGWYYKRNGEVFSRLDEKWVKDLKIVAEYPYPVDAHPVHPPSGYLWKGGFPRLYTAKNLQNDYFLTLLHGGVLAGAAYSEFNPNNLDSISNKRVGLVKEEIIPVPTQPELQLAVGKWYVTKGDYLVKIVSQAGSYFNASLETSPGCMPDGRTAKEIYPQTNGWAYNADTNKISSLAPEWINALEIVAEYPHPVSLPDGYAWKGGFPKLFKNSELDYTDYFISEVDRKALPKVNDAPFIGETRIGLVKVNKPVESIVPVTPIVESEEMKKETAIKVASVAGSLGFRALNYWLFEPAVNTFRPVVKGVRYAVFLGTLASAVYGYKRPDVVKNAIMSCLPSVTIEAPEILK